MGQLAAGGATHCGSIRCVCVINVLSVGVPASSRWQCVCGSPLSWLLSPSPLPHTRPRSTQQAAALFMRLSLRVWEEEDQLQPDSAEDLINFLWPSERFFLPGCRLRPVLNFELRFDLHAKSVGGVEGKRRGGGRQGTSCRHAG